MDFFNDSEAANNCKVQDIDGSAEVPVNEHKIDSIEVAGINGGDELADREGGSDSEAAEVVYALKCEVRFVAKEENIKEIFIREEAKVIQEKVEIFDSDAPNSSESDHDIVDVGAEKSGEFDEDLKGRNLFEGDAKGNLENQIFYILADEPFKEINKYDTAGENDQNTINLFPEATNTNISNYNIECHLSEICNIENREVSEIDDFSITETAYQNCTETVHDDEHEDCSTFLSTREQGRFMDHSSLENDQCINLENSNDCDVNNAEPIEEKVNSLFKDDIPFLSYDEIVEKIHEKQDSFFSGSESKDENDTLSVDSLVSPEEGLTEKIKVFVDNLIDFSDILKVSQALVDIMKKEESLFSPENYESEDSINHAIRQEEELSALYASEYVSTIKSDHMSFSNEKLDEAGKRECEFEEVNSKPQNIFLTSLEQEDSFDQFNVNEKKLELEEQDSCSESSDVEKHPNQMENTGLIVEPIKHQDNMSQDIITRTNDSVTEKAIVEESASSGPAPLSDMEFNEDIDEGLDVHCCDELNNTMHDCVENELFLTEETCNDQPIESSQENYTEETEFLSSLERQNEIQDISDKKNENLETSEGPVDDQERSEIVESNDDEIICVKEEIVFLQQINNGVTDSADLIEVKENTNVEQFFPSNFEDKNDSSKLEENDLNSILSICDDVHRRIAEQNKIYSNIRTRVETNVEILCKKGLHTDEKTEGNSPVIVSENMIELTVKNEVPDVLMSNLTEDDHSPDLASDVESVELNNQIEILRQITQNALVNLSDEKNNKSEDIFLFTTKIPGDKSKTPKLKRKTLVKSPVTRRREIQKLCENFSECENSDILSELYRPVKNIAAGQSDSWMKDDQIELRKENILNRDSSEETNEFKEENVCEPRTDSSSMRFPWLSMTLLLLLLTMALVVADQSIVQSRSMTAFLQDSGIYDRMYYVGDSVKYSCNRAVENGMAAKEQLEARMREMWHQFCEIMRLWMQTIIQNFQKSRSQVSETVGHAEEKVSEKVQEHGDTKVFI